MKPTRHGLFPETLLVECGADNRIYTSSLMVAEYFHKRHAHILDSMNKLISDLPEDFSQPDFRLAEYFDRQKKPRPMYELSHDGFALLAMGFTGKKAMQWKIDFLRAFREMERALAAREARWKGAMQRVRFGLVQTVELTEVGANRAEIGEATGLKPGSVTYRRGVARHLGLLNERPTQRHVLFTVKDHTGSIDAFRRQLYANGETIAECCRRKGVDREAVQTALRGKTTGKHGKSHRAFVALGWK